MDFSFATSSRILVGPGVRAEAAAAAKALGERALLVTGQRAERADWLRDQLGDVGVSTAVFRVGGEPTLDTVRAGTCLLYTSPSPRD